MTPENPYLDLFRTKDFCISSSDNTLPPYFIVEEPEKKFGSFCVFKVLIFERNELLRSASLEEFLDF